MFSSFKILFLIALSQPVFADGPIREPSIETYKPLMEQLHRDLTRIGIEVKSVELKHFEKVHSGGTYVAHIEVQRTDSARIIRLTYPVVISGVAFTKTEVLLPELTRKALLCFITDMGPKGEALSSKKVAALNTQITGVLDRLEKIQKELPKRPGTYIAEVRNNLETRLRSMAENLPKIDITEPATGKVTSVAAKDLIPKTLNLEAIRALLKQMRIQQNLHSTTANFLDQSIKDYVPGESKVDLKDLQERAQQARTQAKACYIISDMLLDLLDIANSENLGRQQVDEEVRLRDHINTLKAIKVGLIPVIEAFLENPSKNLRDDRLRLDTTIKTLTSRLIQLQVTGATISPQSPVHQLSHGMELLRLEQELEAGRLNQDLEGARDEVLERSQKLLPQIERSVMELSTELKRIQEGAKSAVLEGRARQIELELTALKAQIIEVNRLRENILKARRTK